MAIASKKKGGIRNMKIQSSMAKTNNLTQTNQMKKTAQANSKVTRELASGRKVNKAADDAAVLSISEKMIKRVNSLNQGTVNLKSGVDLTRIADGAMNSIAESISDLQSNAIRAMNGTMSDSDRKILQQANEATMETINHIANSTKYNEKNLLNGSSGSTGIYTGTSFSSISDANVTTKALGLDGFSVENPNEIDLSKLDEALKNVSSTRSKMGAQANGMEAAIRSNDNTAENTTAAESRMRDTEMNDAIMRKHTNNYLGAAQTLLLRNQIKQDQQMVSML